MTIEPPVPSLPASGRTAAGSMIEIEFAAGVRMRIIGPVESSTVLALIRLLAKSPRVAVYRERIRECSIALPTGIASPKSRARENHMQPVRPHEAVERRSRAEGE